MMALPIQESAMESQPVTLAQALAIAVQHHQSGRLAEAEGIYRRILAGNPNHADALQLLGTLLGQKGDLRGGEDLLRKSVAIRPDSAWAYLNLGEFCRRQGRPAEALATIMESIRYRPTATAYENMAMALRDLRCDEAAMDALRTARKFDPNFSPAGGAQAIDQWRKQLQMTELNDARECVALCAAFTNLHRYNDAIAAAERAIALQPAMSDPYINLGWLYSLVGRLDDAAAACERAIALNRQDPAAHLNLGVLRLLQGDFSRGWPLYEFRKKCPGFNFAKYAQPTWDGRPLDGKRILLWFEQGLGDTIQFLRFVPEVAARGGKILLSVQPELRRLISERDDIEQFVDPGVAPPAFDVQCSLLSLPLVLATTPDTIPAKTPYISPPEDLAGKWAERMKPVRDQFRVGLSWAGRPGHINDANRSMQLKDLAPLASAGATFISLQKWKTGLTMSELDPSMKLIDWTAELTDLADTAGLIANLDLVISVDSAVAHLAGAMGVPVWLLLPKAPDWRWLLDREDSPWYPTMRLFRQETLGDWTKPVNRMAGAIAALAAAR